MNPNFDERELRSRLRAADIVEPHDSVSAPSVAVIVRRARARRRLRAFATFGPVIGMVVAGLLLLPRVFGPAANNDGDEVFATRYDAAIPWIPAKPSPVHASAPAARCTEKEIDLDVGRTGAYHSLAIQQIGLRNTAGTPCLIDDTPTVALDGEGVESPVGVDTSAIVDVQLQLGPGQIAWLMVGAPASGCENPAALAATARVTLAGSESELLQGVHVPLGCGQPRAVLFEVYSPDVPDSFPIVAQLKLPSTAIAGKTLEYLVALTNRSDDVVRFEPCPRYTHAFKEWAGSSRDHLLNCDAAPSLAPGDTVEFAMEIEVPVEATGLATLNWSFAGDLAAVFDSATVSVQPSS